MNSPVSLRDGPPHPFYSESEMTEYIREFAWSETPLGPTTDWPSELGNAVDLMLGADEAVSIYWGPTHILLYNDAWRTFIEDRHPEALGKPAREVFPEIWETIGPRLAYVMDGNGATFEREQRLQLERDGELQDTWFDYSFNPIPTADGSVGGIFNIGTEVTNRVKAEEALRESEEFHRLAADAGNMGTWSVDLESGDAILSSRMAELMGYAPDEHDPPPAQTQHWQQVVAQDAWMASIHPDDRPAMERAIAEAQENAKPLDLEFRVQHDGGIRWLYAKGEVKADGPGEGHRLRGASVDITQRHDLEEALVSASETVRRDIGRELHDVLSSDLAALAIQADNLAFKLREQAPSSSDASASGLHWENVGRALERLPRAFGLRPSSPEPSPMCLCPWRFRRNTWPRPFNTCAASRRSSENRPPPSKETGKNLFPKTKRRRYTSTASHGSRLLMPSAMLRPNTSGSGFGEKAISLSLRFAMTETASPT